jgi:hypothetical protein
MRKLKLHLLFYLPPTSYALDHRQPHPPFLPFHFAHFTSLRHKPIDKVQDTTFIPFPPFPSLFPFKLYFIPFCSILICSNLLHFSFRNLFYFISFFRVDFTLIRW